MSSTIKPPPLYQHQHVNYENQDNKASRDDCSTENRKGGRTPSIVSNWDKRERHASYEDRSNSCGTFMLNMLQSPRREVILFSVAAHNCAGERYFSHPCWYCGSSQKTAWPRTATPCCFENCIIRSAT